MFIMISLKKYKRFILNNAEDHKHKLILRHIGATYNGVRAN